MRTKSNSNQHSIGAGVISLAIGMAICLIVSATVSGCSKANHTQSPPDAKSLFATLRKQIKPGDSIQRVQDLLGQGAEPQNREKLVAAVKKLAERHPQDCPDGVQNDDEFLSYSIGDNVSFTVQFRKGRLINYDQNKISKEFAVGVAPASP